MAASGKDEPENDSAVTRRRKLYSNHSHGLLPRLDLCGPHFLMDNVKRDLFIALDPPGSRIRQLRVAPQEDWVRAARRLEKKDPRGCDFISLTGPVLHRITDEEPVVALEEVLD